MIIASKKTKKRIPTLKELGFKKMKNTDGLIMFGLVPSKLNKKKGDKND
jgi:hypothetical protein